MTEILRTEKYFCPKFFCQFRLGADTEAPGAREGIS